MSRLICFCFFHATFPPSYFSPLEEISLPLALGEGGEISILQSLGTLIAAAPVGVL